MNTLFRLVMVTIMAMGFLSFTKLVSAAPTDGSGLTGGSPAPGDCSIDNLQNTACKDKILIPTSNICLDTRSCITWFVNVLFLIAVTLAFIYLVWAGIDYILAGGGDPKAAQTKMTNAVVGMVIVIVSWAVSNLILKMFGSPTQVPVNTGTTSALVASTEAGDDNLSTKNN